jgi:predicted ATPase
MPYFLSSLASSQAEIGQVGDALHSIGEALTTVENTKQTWCEAEVHLIEGEVALLGSHRAVAKAQECFADRPVAARAGGRVPRGYREPSSAPSRA